MPKVKTNRAASKRFKVTKNGKVKRPCACKHHKMTHKTARQARHLRQGGYADKTNVKQIKVMLPYC